MIIVDVETTGLHPITHCILSIGAVHSGSGDVFYGECRIPTRYLEKMVSPKALEVNGFTMEQATDPTKPTPEELYKEFLAWCKSGAEDFADDFLLAGTNVGSFDVQFLQYLHRAIDAQETDFEKWPFGYRYVDIHSVGWTVFDSLSSDELAEKLQLDPEERPHHALRGAIQGYKILAALQGWELEEDKINAALEDYEL